MLTPETGERYADLFDLARAEIQRRDAFWWRCAELGIVVVPVIAYSQYGEDGNTHQEHKQGLRFAPLRGDLIAIGPDYWFMVDDVHTGALHDTPDAALRAAATDTDAEK